MDLSAPIGKPYEILPKLDGVLERGDLVWLGFHVNQYFNKTSNADNISMNISFAVLLKRCGRRELGTFLNGEAIEAIDKVPL